jgi:hypothetical protein
VATERDPLTLCVHSCVRTRVCVPVTSLFGSRITRPESTKLSTHFMLSKATEHLPRYVPNLIKYGIPSSGMLRRVALVRTDFLEELGASIIMVKRRGKPRNSVSSN